VVGGVVGEHFSEAIGTSRETTIAWTRASMLLGSVPSSYTPLMHDVVSVAGSTRSAPQAPARQGSAASS
jgi:hypothetical protein